MNCSRVTKLYDVYRRGLLSERGDRQVGEHLAGCLACREVFEENETLVTLLEESSELSEAPPQQYYQRLAARTIERLNTRYGLWERFGEGLREAIHSFRWRPLAQYATVGAFCLLVGWASPSLLNQPWSDAPPSEQPLPKENIVDYPQPTPLAETVDPDSSETSLIVAENGGERSLPASITKSARNNQMLGANSAAPPVALIALDADGLAALGSAFGTNFAKIIRQAQQAPAQTVITDKPPLVEAKTIQPEVEWALTLNQIQQLKFDLYQAGNLAQVRAIREIESAIEAAQGNAEQTSTLAAYHQAEDAFLEGDYFPAMKLYRQIIIEKPNSMRAAHSRFQMANIRFELQDYENAFREYKECLDAKKYFTQDKHDWIMQRAQLLVDNEIDNYQPLRLFKLAERSSDVEVLNIYRQLLEQYPKSSLALETVQRLRQLAIYGGSPDRIPVSARSAIGILRRCALAAEDAAVAAQAQLAVGDITWFRLQNIRQARLEYGLIFEMTDDDDILEQVRKRLKQLSMLETSNH